MAISTTQGECQNRRFREGWAFDQPFRILPSRQVSPSARPEDVIALLDALAPIKLVVPDGGIVRRAVEARSAYGLHFFDGVIVASAERAKCGRIWSEDLNAGQQYFGVTVVNPFKA